MKTLEACRSKASSLGDRAKVRLQGAQGEPLFVANWDEVLMIHFTVEPRQLQRDVGRTMHWSIARSRTARSVQRNSRVPS